MEGYREGEGLPYRSAWSVLGDSRRTPTLRYWWLSSVSWGVQDGKTLEGVHRVEAEEAWCGDSGCKGSGQGWTLGREAALGLSALPRKLG